MGRQITYFNRYKGTISLKSSRYAINCYNFKCSMSICSTACFSLIFQCNQFFLSTEWLQHFSLNHFFFKFSGTNPCGILQASSLYSLKLELNVYQACHFPHDLKNVYFPEQHPMKQNYFDLTHEYIGLLLSFVLRNSEKLCLCAIHLNHTIYEDNQPIYMCNR